MEQTTEPVIVGVRFSKVGKVYHFAADAITDIKVGDMVVVETTRGWQLGQVAQIVPNAEPPPDGWKPIDRRATPRDLLLRQMWQMKESEVIASCKSRASDLRLVGIKIVSAEYSFDGSRLSIQFSSETEEKYDLKSLRSDMQKMFAPSQVEMRQIGPRDVAKTHCGMGACGLETRCCCLFLTEFSSISIRMAKEQGISLTPTEITGMCGRLRCCLIYEYDTYVDARSKLPKRNKRVRTPQGEGKVVDVIPLRGAVVVDLPEIGYREFPGSDVQLVDGDGNQQANQPAAPSGQAASGTALNDSASTGTDTTPASAAMENIPVSSETRPAQRSDRPRQDRPRQDRARQDRTGGDRPAGEAVRPESGERTRPGGPGSDRPRKDMGRRGGTGSGGGPDRGSAANNTANTAAGAEEKITGAQPDQQTRRRGPRSSQPGSQPGERPPRRDGGRRGGGSGPNGVASATPTSDQPKPQGTGAATENPTGPSGESTSQSTPRGGREQRRRKGRRRDNSSGNEERA